MMLYDFFMWVFSVVHERLNKVHAKPVAFADRHVCHRKMLQLLPDAVSLTRFMAKGSGKLSETFRNIDLRVSKPGQRTKLETEIEKDFPQQAFQTPGYNIR